MLTFFRRIRKGLLNSNNTNRYLLYSIGEILLVMIGILLALQVNNWNEYRKERKSERELLVGLQAEIIKNKSSLQEAIKNQNGELNSYLALLEKFSPNPTGRTETELDTLIGNLRQGGPLIRDTDS